MEKEAKKTLIADLRQQLHFHQMQVQSFSYMIGLLEKDIDLDGESSLPFHSCD